MTGFVMAGRRGLLKRLWLSFVYPEVCWKHGKFKTGCRQNVLWCESCDREYKYRNRNEEAILREKYGVRD